MKMSYNISEEIGEIHSIGSIDANILDTLEQILLNRNQDSLAKIIGDYKSVLTDSEVLAKLKNILSNSDDSGDAELFTIDVQGETVRLDLIETVAMDTEEFEFISLRTIVINKSNSNTVKRSLNDLYLYFDSEDLQIATYNYIIEQQKKFLNIHNLNNSK
jgi:hypothetical protein